MSGANSANMTGLEVISKKLASGEQWRKVDESIDGLMVQQKWRVLQEEKDVLSCSAHVKQRKSCVYNWPG